MRRAGRGRVRSGFPGFRHRLQPIRHAAVHQSGQKALRRPSASELAFGRCRGRSATRPTRWSATIVRASSADPRKASSAEQVAGDVAMIRAGEDAMPRIGQDRRAEIGDRQHGGRRHAGRAARRSRIAVHSCRSRCRPPSVLGFERHRGCRRGAGPDGIHRHQPGCGHAQRPPRDGLPRPAARQFGDPGRQRDDGEARSRMSSRAPARR